MRGSCRAGETAPWLRGLGHQRLGLPFLRGKKVREGAMGGETEFLLTWKHVSEGHSDLDVCKLLRRLSPIFTLCVREPSWS